LLAGSSYIGEADSVGLSPWACATLVHY
jgi:hypothetical protein